MPYQPTPTSLPSRKTSKTVARMNGARSILELIGSTPVVKLRNLPADSDAEVWAKMESFNPGGSVKDRICFNMIETAERVAEVEIERQGWGVVAPRKAVERALTLRSA